MSLTAIRMPNIYAVGLYTVVLGEDDK